MSQPNRHHRIVVKVGTSTLTYGSGKLNLRCIERLARIISDLHNCGYELVLVSSGAIGVGANKLGLRERPRTTRMKQAAAAVGQCELMYTYDKLFLQYNQTVAQILLTAEDLRTPDRHMKFENTMQKLLELRALPIINENDTVSTDELQIGDNDTLAAIVAESTGADLLVLMSDIDGLYDKDPHKFDNAVLIRDVFDLNDDIMALGGDAGTARGTGGMATKLQAAKIANSAGCDMIIMQGDNPESLYSIIDGNPIGTKFHAKRV